MTLHHRRASASIRRAALILLVFASGPAAAQTVESITTLTPDLGTVVSAPSGDTVFRVSPSTGAITRVSGTGIRLGSTSSRALVTIACDSGSCQNKTLQIRVGSFGSPTGRAGSLTNFTVSPGTATISSVSGTDPLTFTMGSLRRDESATFWVGADVPIAGNDSAAASGNATSRFYVYVAIAPTTPTSGSTVGLATARVFRPISMSTLTSLAFGTVVRPSSGAATVAIDAATGARTVTGTGARGFTSPAPTRAVLNVTGEGGQTVSLSRPTSFQMTGPGSPLTVNLSSTSGGTGTLSSALGSSGSYSFGVGGSFAISSTTSTGAYSGSYTVTVQYN